MRRLALLLPLLLATACGKPPAGGGGDDPAALWTAFDQLMRSGNYAQVAAMVDFKAAAAADNPDFAAFPSSQQTLITGEMKKSTIAALAGLGYPSSGLKAGPPQVTGETATIASEDGSIALTLTRSADGWKIIGGLPGMTPG